LIIGLVLGCIIGAIGGYQYAIKQNDCIHIKIGPR
jgi:hypothetical protein